MWKIFHWNMQTLHPTHQSKVLIQLYVGYMKFKFVTSQCPLNLWYSGIVDVYIASL
jgi:hypothetical protein